MEANRIFPNSRLEKIHSNREVSTNSSIAKTDLYLCLDANKLLASFGKYGKYQMACYTLCQFLNFFYAASLFVIPFIQNKPNFKCNISEQNTNIIEEKSAQCTVIDTVTNKTDNCGEITGTKVTFSETERAYSILAEFDLLCSHPIMQELGFSIFSFGAMITVPVISYLCDLYGRRKLLLITIYMSVFCNIAAAVAPNYALYIILRLLVGASSDSYLTIASILSCELVVEDLRDWIGLIYTVAWLSGYLYIGVLTLFFSKWRELYFAMAVPGLITLFYICVIPESPHWMLAHGQKDGIKNYVKRASWINKKEVNLRECLVEGSAVKEKRKENRTSLSFCGRKRIVFVMLINGFITMVMSLYYFAISLDSVNMSENRLMGYMLAGVVELPGGVIAIPLMHYFGRRSITVCTLISQGILVIIASLFEETSMTRMVFVLFGKMVNSITDMSHPMLVSEMMATTIRTISYSLINIPQSIGVMLSPLIKYTDMGDGKLPNYILGGLTMLAGISAMALPETKGVPMPEDPDQMDPGPLLRYFIDWTPPPDRSITPTSE